ncbi:hypothetical protein T4D_1999, partial [Trichinella pseudospiralis]
MLAQNFSLIVILMQLWQCKSILFAAYLKDDQMTCVLDQLEVSSSSLELYEMQILWNKTFDECILICNLLRLENKCNAIKYYQTLMKCYLLAAPINSTTTETQHQSYKIFFIYECLKGSYYLHEIGNYPMLVSGGTFISVQLEILNLTIITERRPTVDSIRSKIIENDEKASTGDCVVTCYARSWHNGCNAVVYNPKTSLCTLLKHETPLPPITFTHHEMTLMLLLHLGILNKDRSYAQYIIRTAGRKWNHRKFHSKIFHLDTEKIRDPNTKQAKRISTKSFVHLYRYMEVCEVNIIHNRKIENVTRVQVILNVRSVNKCLHFCRPWLRQFFYCAIIYSKHNYKCELLIRSTERSSTRFVDNEEKLAELLNCHADRQSLRRNNPPPIRYYLKEIGKICVLEFYNATQLRGFYPIETLENVENIKSCIYACRLRYSSYICLAINYTMKKQCILLRQESNHEIYNVKSQSLFAEILFCEPGTLADEIFDF